jgi:hypothetical protein
MNTQDRQALLATLQARFAQHPARHAGVAWPQVLDRLGRSPALLRALQAMEASGGEPDVLLEDAGGTLAFYDCAPESPAGRRSLCFDRAALDERKENKPAGCVVDSAQALGAELLDEARYRLLQQFGEFDRKTSSWIATPPDVRALGGALFGDRRYGRVFVYHNGAGSYYAARGFRTRLAL